MGIGSSTHDSKIFSPAISATPILTGHYDIIQIPTEPHWTNIVNFPSPGHNTSEDTIDVNVNVNLVPDSDVIIDSQDVITPNDLENTSDVYLSSTVNRELLDRSNNGSQDVTTNSGKETSQPDSSQLDQDSAHIKELCKSLRLPESVYSSNFNVHYPVLTPEHDDIDYINFKDIINKSWSIPLENMSSEDIQQELDFLKHQRTSSPNVDHSSVSTFSEKDDEAASNEDNLMKDPTYGLPKKEESK